MHSINLSEALSIFENHLPDIRKACVQNAQYYTSQHPEAKELENEWTKEAIHAHVEYLALQKKLEPITKVLKRIDGRKRYFSKHSITDEDIIAAKEVLIEELYDGKLIGRKRKTGKCPFHDERTPSFVIFPDNRYYCFGCQVHGTAIDFVMQRDGLDFISAVKMLRGNHATITQ